MFLGFGGLFEARWRAVYSVCLSTRPYGRSLPTAHVGITPPWPTRHPQAAFVCWCADFDQLLLITAFPTTKISQNCGATHQISKLERQLIPGCVPVTIPSSQKPANRPVITTAASQCIHSFADLHIHPANLTSLGLATFCYPGGALAR